MNLLQLPRRLLRLLRGGAAAILLCVAAGCGREEIRVYSVPKEDPWQLPAGWKAREAGQMRAAQFVAPGKGGTETDISLIPIKGQMARPEMIPDIVNIWRQQMQLDPIEAADLAKLGQKVPVGRAESDLVEMVSTEPVLDGKKQRTLVATLNSDGTTWFIKMAGEDAAVTQEKPAFLAFLKSLNLDAVPPPLPASSRTASPSGREAPQTTSQEKPQWTIPSGWQEAPPTQMLLAKFVISGQSDGRAEVTVSAFPGGAGGMLANINRWRDQLQLEHIGDSGLSNLLSSLDLPSGKAILVDMNGTDAKTGQPARIIGAIQEREGLTWFYKMTGSDQTAAREKESFINFLKTVKYPNG